MELRNLWIVPCSVDEVTPFAVEHHYLHSVKGATPSHCFLIRDGNDGPVVGAAIFGISGQLQTTKKYSEDGTIKMVELLRLVLLDECPRNSESRVISIMLRHLAKIGIQRVLSFADPNEKRPDHPEGMHTGLIYRAAGFHLVTKAGTTKAIWWNDRRYPIRNLHQYNNYHTKPAFWDEIPDDKKIRRREKHGTGTRWVWVPKIPSERIGIAKRLWAALAAGAAKYRPELRKIGYLKDLQKGMPYFDPPKKTPTLVPLTEPAPDENIST
jgi:hypothetical protein